MHLIEINDPAKGSTAIYEFASLWNAMGTNKKGDKVRIDAVIINTHAGPSSLSNNSGWRVTADDIATLKSKDPELIILYGCKAGHLDYRDSNMASAFAKKVKKAPVLAGDGTVQSSKKYLYLFGSMTYEPLNDKTFKDR